VAVFCISCCMIIIDTQHSVGRPMFYLAIVFKEKMDGAEKISVPLYHFYY